METATHGNGKGLDDLYILPASEQEAGAIVAYLDSREIRHHWGVSDTTGQSWHGKRFIEIPFGEGYASVIQQAVAGQNSATN